jgi:hypothetical protein
MPDIYEKTGRRYKPRPDLAALSYFDPHSLVIGAQRYYIGRETIVAAVFAQCELARAWPHLPLETRSVMQRDIEREFERDDEARDRGAAIKPLGWDCDRAAWAKVREYWHGHDTPAAQHVPTPTEIVQRMRILSEQARELVAAMDYYGGVDGRMAALGREMVDAGMLAKEWEQSIEEERVQQLRERKS